MTSEDQRLGAVKRNSLCPPIEVIDDGLSVAILITGANQLTPISSTESSVYKSPSVLQSAESKSMQ